MKKIYNMLDRTMLMILPMTIFFYFAYEVAIYDEENDSGGWGGLALASALIISFVWWGIILVINKVFKKYSKKYVVNIVMTIVNICISTYILGFFDANLMAYSIIIMVALLIVYIVCLIKLNISKNV